MKIEKITLYQVGLKLKTPFKTSFGEMSTRRVLLIKVESQGYVGWGESPHLDLPLYTSEYLEGGKVLLQQLIPRIVGKELTHPSGVLTFYQDIKGNNISKAGIEMAMWDLFSRKEGVPLYKYLGAKKNISNVGVSIGIKKNIQELIDSIEKFKDYSRIKIKIKPGWDVEIVKKIKETFPEIILMVDANSAYTINDLEHLKQLDQFKLLMIEQPFGEDKLLDHVKLQASLKTPVCLDESIHTFDDAKDAIELKSCKIINIKPARVGGITETLKIHNLCHQKNIPVWVGGMIETIIGKSFLDHISTLPNFMLPGDNSDSSRYFEEDLAKTRSPHEKGMIFIPDTHGIGVVPEEEMLKKHAMVIQIYSA